jgi:hypothetical protein
MAAVPVPTPRDDLITYGSAYALVTVLLIWLDIGGIPDNYFDMTAHWISSLSLLIACYILLRISLDALGKTLLPDDHIKGDYRTCIGALMGILVVVIVAALTHWIDEKMFFYQLFWVQVLALPGACITARFLDNAMNDKEEWLWKFGAYRLINLMLWLDLQNAPPDSLWELNPFTFVGWWLSLIVLLFMDVFYLIESIVHDFEPRSKENPKAGVLITVGAITGVGIVLCVMVPLELWFHFLRGKYWVYQILIAELGILPGARLIGYSAWLARLYAGRQSTPLTGYSKIDTEEAQV